MSDAEDCVADRAGMLRVLGALLLAVYVALSSAWLYRGAATQLLWFCDASLLLMAVGLLSGSARVVSAQLTAVWVFHAAWNADFWSYVLLGRFINGSTDYMFLPTLTVAEKALSFFAHIAVVPAGLYATYRLGASRHAWVFQTVQTSALFLLSCWLSSPEDNINWVFGARGFRPPPLLPYRLAVLVLLPLVVYRPTSLLLTRLMPGRNRLTPPPRDIVATSTPTTRPGRFPAMGYAAVCALIATTALGAMAVAVRADRRSSFHEADAREPGAVTALERIGSGSTLVDGISFGNESFVGRERLPQIPGPVLPRRAVVDSRLMPIHVKGALDRIAPADLPSVPQEVALVGRRSRPGSVVCAVVASDALYAQQDCDLLVHQDRYRVRVSIGGRGVSEFVDRQTGMLFEASPGNEILGNGVGGVYAVATVEVLRGEAVSRSPFFLVKRAGIMLPDDVWYVQERGTLRPLLERGAAHGQGRLAFQSCLAQDGRPAVYVADFLGYRAQRVSPVSVDGGFYFPNDRWCPEAGWVSSRALRYCVADPRGAVPVVADVP